MIHNVHSANRNNFKHYLGKTTREIAQSLGRPFASYTFRDQEIYVYDSKPVSSIALQNGIVVSCNAEKDSRTAPRIKLQQDVPILFNGDCTKRGLLVDLSVKSALISFEKSESISPKDVSSLSFSLTVDGISRFISIPCNLKETRKDLEKELAIFIFDFNHDQWKKRIISRYISLNTVISSLNWPY